MTDRPAIQVTYRRTTRLSMRIGQHGNVLVSAPIGISRDKVLDFINQNHQWIIAAQQSKHERQERRNNFYAQIDLSDKDAARHAVEKLHDIVRPIIATYEKRMGVQIARLSVKPMTSRWGSCCKATRQISLSIYLLLLPTPCIEYVIVHEMAHLFEANHSPRFYAILDRYYPEHREVRARIRNIMSKVDRG